MGSTSDESGYADGEGTLKWYSNGNYVSKYTGKMVRGKFEGMTVRVGKDGDSSRVYYKHGKRVKESSTGSAGRYILTKDTEAKVWNNKPQAGEHATWSGDKDSADYATGHGVLTWYKRGVFTYEYEGTMVKGKFDGETKFRDSKGREDTCLWENGVRTESLSKGRWLNTDNGKVWNNKPKKGDSATWSGDIDAESKATGRGKLRWFRDGVYMYEYEGKMVSGKFTGETLVRDNQGNEDVRYWDEDEN